jgi:hypothetical protein
MEFVCLFVDCIHVSEEKDDWCAVVNVISLVQFNSWGFLHRLSDC